MAGKKKDLTSAALDALPLAVLIADGGGSILVRNAAAKEQLPAGKTIGDVLNVEEDAALSWDDELASLAETPRGLTRRNVPLAGKGERRLLADVHLRLLAGADGQGRGAVLVAVQDVSARVSMERRLSAGERLAAAGQLAGKFAHELNNPLDGVLRYIGLAQRVCKGAAGVKYLEKAHLGLTRMAGVIRNLMAESSAWQPGARCQPIGRLLDEAIIAMNPRAQALGVSVVSDFEDAAAAPVPGDLFQVFCNIIKNALDAMPNGGLLSLRLRGEGARYVVEFVDTGCGMSPEEAGRVFEPFYTTKPHGEGAGLGLAICREILARCGGTIAAGPRPEGGAVVTVTAPMVREEGEPRG